MLVDAIAKTGKSVHYTPDFDAAEAYLRAQGRFKGLDAADIAAVEAGRDKKWQQIERDWAKQGS